MTSSVKVENCMHVRNNDEGVHVYNTLFRNAIIYCSSKMNKKVYSR